MFCHFILKVVVLLITLPGILLSEPQFLDQLCLNAYGSEEIWGVCKRVENCLGAAFHPSFRCNDYQSICCIDDKDPPILAEDPQLTKLIFLKIVGDTPRNAAMYSYFVESLQLANLTTTSWRWRAEKKCAYLSQVVGETKSFEKLESGKPDADVDEDLGNTEIGDGSLWQGRGGIMVRGKNAYELANEAKDRYGINCFI
jgi:hypothetical protein